MTEASIDRRKFIATAATTTAAVTLTRPRAARAADEAKKIRLGLIGCGGRGKWIAKLFAAHGAYQVVAVCDYFADRAAAAAKDHDVPADRQYTGLGGYKKLLASDIDAVAIISPPFFHPEQAAAAVSAGKHVYLAKPVAVDVPGCHSITASGAAATSSNLAFRVDFQTRMDPFYLEALQRVHDGAIGDFAFGEASYHAGRLGKRGEDNTPEGRLRNWVFDKALSGDIITEQNIHTLDVMSWIMKAPPQRAVGGCARKVRLDAGDCSDTFSLVYEYADHVNINFSSRQFDAYGSKPDGIRNRMFGTDGVLETMYGGLTFIRGKNFYKGGASPGIYKDGAAANIAAFADEIHRKDFANTTVAPSVQSNLITIMGRTAAYTGKIITWDQFVKSTDRIDGRLEGLKL